MYYVCIYIYACIYTNYKVEKAAFMDALTVAWSMHTVCFEGTQRSFNVSELYGQFCINITLYIIQYVL